jgi:hypothetical protein
MTKMDDLGKCDDPAGCSSFWNTPAGDNCPVCGMRRYGDYPATIRGDDADSLRQELEAAGNQIQFWRRATSKKPGNPLLPEARILKPRRDIRASPCACYPASKGRPHDCARQVLPAPHSCVTVPEHVLYCLREAQHERATPIAREPRRDLPKPDVEIINDRKRKLDASCWLRTSHLFRVCRPVHSTDRIHWIHSVQCKRTERSLDHSLDDIPVACTRCCPRTRTGAVAGHPTTCQT